MITIEIKTPMEVIKDIKTKREQRKALLDELTRARRVRGLMRVKLAESRGTNDAIATNLRIAEAYVSGLEMALGTK